MIYSTVQDSASLMRLQRPAEHVGQYLRILQFLGYQG